MFVRLWIERWQCYLGKVCNSVAIYDRFFCGFYCRLVCDYAWLVCCLMRLLDGTCVFCGCLFLFTCCVFCLWFPVVCWVISCFSLLFVVFILYWWVWWLLGWFCVVICLMTVSCFKLNCCEFVALFVLVVYCGWLPLVCWILWLLFWFD